MTNLTNETTDACIQNRCNGICGHAITRIGDRYYITMGHPGFNSPANNAGGYRTANLALAAIKKYTALGEQISADDDIARAIKILELAAMKSALIKGKAARLQHAIASAQDALRVQ